MGFGQSKSNCKWKNSMAMDYVLFLKDLFGKPFIFINRPDGVAVWRKNELSKRGLTLFQNPICFEKIMVKDSSTEHSYPAPGHTDFLWTMIKIPSALTKDQVCDLGKLCDNVTYMPTDKMLTVCCGGLDFNIATLKLCTDLLLNKATLADMQSGSAYAKTMAAVRQSGKVNMPTVKQLYLSLYDNMMSLAALAARSKEHYIADADGSNDPWYSSNNPLDIALAEFNNRQFYHEPNEFNLADITPVNTNQFLVKPGVQVIPPTPTSQTSTPFAAASARSHPENFANHPEYKQKANMIQGAEHFAPYPGEPDPRFLPYTALISYEIGSNINEITRLYGTVQQKITYPTYTNMMKYGLVTMPPEPPAAPKGPTTKDFRPLDVVKQEEEAKAILKAKQTKQAAFAKQAALQAAQAAALAQLTPEQRAQAAQVQLGKQERLTVASDYTDDRFLDVITGERQAHGPLARIGRLNPANRHNEHLTVASDYTDDRFLDVLTGERQAHGPLARIGRLNPANRHNEHFELPPEADSNYFAFRQYPKDPRLHVRGPLARIGRENIANRQNNDPFLQVVEGRMQAHGPLARIGGLNPANRDGMANRERIANRTSTSDLYLQKTDGMPRPMY